MLIAKFGSGYAGIMAVFGSIFRFIGAIDENAIQSLLLMPTPKDTAFS